VLVLSGYGLGLFFAAQVGPVTLLIVRSILRGGRALAVGLAMAAAVVVIDLAYAIVGLAGVGSLLSGGSLRLSFGLISAAVLIGIGMRTLWVGWRARVGLEPADDVVAPSRAFLTAVAATALNPLTIPDSVF
jgi:putative LysE/RhtB family amino acid efflux pump